MRESYLRASGEPKWAKGFGNIIPYVNHEDWKVENEGIKVLSYISLHYWWITPMKHSSITVETYKTWRYEEY